MFQRLAHALSCNDATVWISRNMDQRLPPLRALQIWAHVRVCALCRRFRFQARFLRRALRSYARMTERQAAGSVRLSADARMRLQRALQE